MSKTPTQYYDPPISDPRSDPHYDLEDSYRAVSKPAMISLILGFISIPASFAVPLLVLPVFGVVLGLFGIRSIRRFPHELSGAWAAKTGVVLCALVFALGVGTHTYVYFTEVPEGYTRISFAELQPDRKTPHLPIPPTAKDLDGEKIFVKGYVFPDGQKSGIKRFILVPDMGTCCFGGDPAATDMIEVTLKDPHRVEYSFRRLKLTGVFHVTESPKIVDKKKFVYYHLIGDGVR